MVPRAPLQSLLVLSPKLQLISRAVPQELLPSLQQTFTVLLSAVAEAAVIWKFQVSTAAATNTNICTAAIAAPATRTIVYTAAAAAAIWALQLDTAADAAPATTTNTYAAVAATDVIWKF